MKKRSLVTDEVSKHENTVVIQNCTLGLLRADIALMAPRTEVSLLPVTELHWAACTRNELKLELLVQTVQVLRTFLNLEVLAGNTVQLVMWPLIHSHLCIMRRYSPSCVNCYDTA